MRIRVKREHFVDGKNRPAGTELTVADATGRMLIHHGIAVEVEKVTRAAPEVEAATVDPGEEEATSRKGRIGRRRKPKPEE